MKNKNIKSATLNLVNVIRFQAPLSYCHIFGNETLDRTTYFAVNLASAVNP